MMTGVRGLPRFREPTVNAERRKACAQTRDCVYAVARSYLRISSPYSAASRIDSVIPS